MKLRYEGPSINNMRTTGKRTGQADLRSIEFNMMIDGILAESEPSSPDRKMSWMGLFP